MAASYSKIYCNSVVTIPLLKFPLQNIENYYTSKWYNETLCVDQDYNSPKLIIVAIPVRNPWDGRVFAKLG